MGSFWPAMALESDHPGFKSRAGLPCYVTSGKRLHRSEPQFPRSWLLLPGPARPPRGVTEIKVCSGFTRHSQRGLLTHLVPFLSCEPEQTVLTKRSSINRAVNPHSGPRLSGRTPALRGDRLARGSPLVIGKSRQHPANLTAMTWDLA